MEDRDIVALYWQRDPKAIENSQQKYGTYCAAIAQRLLDSREDAEECVADTWLAAWNAIPPHQPAVLRTFLGKLTRRLSLLMLRQQGRLKRGGGETALALEELAECVGSDTTEQTVERRELRRVLDRFLESLNDQQRQVFLARYWYGVSVDEIAEKWHFSPAKVKSMLHRTRKKLRAALEKEGY